MILLKKTFLIETRNCIIPMYNINITPIKNDGLVKSYKTNNFQTTS